MIDDFYMQTNAKYVSFKLRVQIYKIFLNPFKSVKLDYMSQVFNIDKKYLI